MSKRLLQLYSVKPPDVPNFKAITDYLASNPNIDIAIKGPGGESLIQLAARYGHVQVVQKLIDLGADINAADSFQHTPLIESIGYNQPEVFELLLRQKAIEINKPNLDGRTPIWWAVSAKRSKMIADLIKHPDLDFDYRDKYDFSILQYAISENNLDAVKLLLPDQTSLNRQDKYGCTPLMLSVRFANLGITKYLLKREGLLINLWNKKGDTALIHAAAYRNMNAVKLLASDPRVDLNHMNKEGETVLSLLVVNRETDIIKLLLKKGARWAETTESQYEEFYKLLKVAGHILGLHSVASLTFHGEKVDVSAEGNTVVDSSTMLYQYLDRYRQRVQDLGPVAPDIIQRQINPAEIKRQLEAEAAAQAQTSEELKFLEENLNTLEILNEAVEAAKFQLDYVKAVGTVTASDLLHRFNNKKYVVITVEWQGHTVAIVLYDDYLVVVNRGEGRLEGAGNTLIYKIKPEQISAKFIASLTPTGRVITKEELNLKLATVVKDLNKPLFRLKTKDQGHDTCSADNLQNAEIEPLFFFKAIEILQKREKQFAIAQKQQVKAAQVEGTKERKTRVESAKTRPASAAMKRPSRPTTARLPNTKLSSIPSTARVRPATAQRSSAHVPLVKRIKTQKPFNVPDISLKAAESFARLGYKQASNGYRNLVTSDLIEEYSNSHLMEHHDRTAFSLYLLIEHLAEHHGQEKDVQYPRKLKMEQELNRAEYILRHLYEDDKIFVLLKLKALKVDLYGPAFKQNNHYIVGECLKVETINQNPIMFIASQTKRTRPEKQLAFVKMLINNKEKLNEKDNNGMTALMWAAQNGHSDLVKALLTENDKNRADPNMKDSKKRTAIFFACKAGHLEVVKELLRNGAAVNTKDFLGRTPLFEAIESGKAEIVEEILKHKLDINEIDLNNSTALHHAFAQLPINKEIIKILLKNNALTNVKDKAGYTPIMFARMTGDSAIIDLFAHLEPPAPK